MGEVVSPNRRYTCREFLHEVNWKVISPDSTVGIYIQYIYITKIVVLVSEPVRGRSRATELPCFECVCYMTVILTVRMVVYIMLMIKFAMTIVLHNYSVMAPKADYIIITIISLSSHGSLDGYHFVVASPPKRHSRCLLPDTNQIREECRRVTCS